MGVDLKGRNRGSSAPIVLARGVCGLYPQLFITGDPSTAATCRSDEDDRGHSELHPRNDAREWRSDRRSLPRGVLPQRGGNDHD